MQIQSPHTYWMIHKLAGVNLLKKKKKKEYKYNRIPQIRLCTDTTQSPGQAYNPRPPNLPSENSTIITFGSSNSPILSAPLPALPCTSRYDTVASFRVEDLGILYPLSRAQWSQQEPAARSTWVEDRWNFNDNNSIPDLNHQTPSNIPRLIQLARRC